MAEMSPKSVRDYHQRLLGHLKGQTFDELNALPVAKAVTPPGKTKWKFTQRRRKTKAGGVMVSVERSWTDMKYVFSFEKRSDGTVLEEEVIIDD
jgi:hypothetical protein